MPGVRGNFEVAKCHFRIDNAKVFDIPTQRTIVCVVEALQY